MYEVLGSNHFSFFGRLALYSGCALMTGGYFWGLLAYLVIDLIVMDLVLKYIYGLQKLAPGLDSVFLELAVINCFYITLDKRMNSIQDIKE